MPAPKWLIEGLFEVNSLVMLAGPPASFKSFLTIDWVMCMATGRKWNDKVTVPQRVLYCLGEGKASLLKRMQAWMHYHQITREEKLRLAQNFRVTFDVPQLASETSVTNMLSELVAEGYEPEVIVIDTFARSFVGLDENSQRDTGLWVEQADRLRQKGYTVIFLHHTAKNTEFGLKYRGSSAIMGAMDSAFTLAKDFQNPSISVLTCVKQKDHDEGDPLCFKRLVVCPDPATEGSIVLVPTVKLDERFTEEFQAAEAERDFNMKNLMDDNSFESDRARAKELAARTGLSEAAAQKRISRARGET